jgi:hypothetical protein
MMMVAPSDVLNRSAKTRSCIHGATRRVWHDQGDGAGRISLGLRKRHGQERGNARAQMQKIAARNFYHNVLSKE